MAHVVRLNNCSWMRRVIHPRYEGDVFGTGKVTMLISCFHSNVAGVRMGTMSSSVLHSATYRTPCSEFVSTSAISLPNQFYHSSCFLFQQRKADDNGKRRGDIIESKEKPFSELSLGQKVTRAGKDATYTGIVIAGIAVTGIMFFAIGRELFSGQSPSGIYGRAFKLCKKNEEICDALGQPIKGYGEMTSRGRRRFVRHTEYEMNGVKYMKMQFYLEGPVNKATVHLEVQQDERGKYQFRYLVVELNSYPHRTIVVQDNR